jgi:hypothetical protein
MEGNNRLNEILLSYIVSMVRFAGMLKFGMSIHQYSRCQRSVKTRKKRFLIEASQAANSKSFGDFS